MENQNRSFKKENQIAEGFIGQYKEDIQDKLPSGITKEMVELFLGSDGLWHWHLKPEFIGDEEEKREYEDEKVKWLLAIREET